MIVDVARCENCRNCFLAVKDEHVGNDFPGYAAAQPAHEHSWIDIVRKERGRWPIVEANFMPTMCNHCDDAPCMAVAENGAVRKRDDGIVIIDPEKAKGQRAIVEACPYGAVFWNEEKELPQAWIFDAHLLDSGWSKTRAEQVCPTGVFQSVKVSDAEMKQRVESEGLEVLKPEIGSRPRVYYKNLHLITSCFVSGSVVTVLNGVEECVADAEVSLSRNREVFDTTRTDIFGDFKLDKLSPGSGPYELRVVHGNLGSAFRTFSVEQDSIYLGVISL